MGGCAGPSCKNTTEKGFRLFRFPSEPQRRRTWIENARRGGPCNITKNSRLCESHFGKDQFEQNRADKWNKLKPTAVPTIFGPTRAKPQRGPLTPVHQNCQTPESLEQVSPYTEQQSPKPPAESRDENSPPSSASMAHTSAQNTVGTVLFHSEISTVQGLLSLSSCLLQSSKPHVCPSGDQTCTAEGRTLDVGTGLEPMMTRKFEIEVGSAAAETPVTKVPEHNQGQAKSSAAYSLEPVSSDVNRGTAAEECDPSVTCKDTVPSPLDLSACSTSQEVTSKEMVPSPLDLSACGTSQEVTSKEMDVELLGTACDDDVCSIPSVEVPSPLDLSACSTSQRCDISVSCSETTLSSTEKEQLLERIKWLERAHRRDQKKIRALEQQKEIFHEHLSDMFNSDQLSAISRHSNRGSKWPESTIKKALQLHFSCGSSGYDDILEQKLPYPSARTLRRRVEGIKFQPGVLHEVFELLQAKVPALGPQERCSEARV
ncbi:uncharacterized protein LOC135384525 [Ornithodoros turicata]|uniref:uncharacterized protein LOC135384525 n=1 Tax=Ornithodoros turicata TaxID=34597 RepID=UPI003138E8CF